LASYTYLRKKQKKLSEINSKRGSYGNEVKRRKMAEHASALRVTGTMITSGVFGDHCIELLADYTDPIHCWMRVDGELRNPRTCAGVKRIVGEWLWRKRNRKITKPDFLS